MCYQRVTFSYFLHHLCLVFHVLWFGKDLCLILHKFSVFFLNFVRKKSLSSIEFRYIRYFCLSVTSDIFFLSIRKTLSSPPSPWRSLAPVAERARPRPARSSAFPLRTKLALDRGASPLAHGGGARSVRLNFCSREELCGRVHGDGAHPCAARCSSPRARLPGMLLSPILAAASVLFLFLHRPLINWSLHGLICTSNCNCSLIRRAHMADMGEEAGDLCKVS